MKHTTSGGQWGKKKDYAVIETDVFDKIHSFSPERDSSHAVQFNTILLSKEQYFQTMQKSGRCEV